MNSNLGRRQFLQNTAASAFALSAAAHGVRAAECAAAGKVTEPAREVPVVDQTDVVVCGAGPAGVAAALSAARAGASVRLIETHGQLGGIWTTGLLSWVIDAGNKDGIMREIIGHVDRRMKLLGTEPWNVQGSMPYDVEQMKWILDQLCSEAGVKVRLHTRVVAAVKEGRQITHCVTESKSGREAFAGRVFIDGTGDGDLAALAGCQFDWGRPATGVSALPGRAGETQPFSLMMLITGIDPLATLDFYEREGRAWNAPKDALMAEFRRAGVESSYGKPTIFKIHDDLYAWMVNHEYGFSGIDAEHVTQATMQARAEVHRLVDALRTLGDPWKDVKIIATGSQIGVREGRRIRGRYTVTLDDMLRGARFEDGICRVTFGIDVHSTNKAHSTGIEAKPVKQRTQPYDIPLRSLIAADVDGLMMAGRCISGDFLAHSSYRVTGNAVAMGEAAGQTAAQAIDKQLQPHEVM
jgi:hypothetical protein